MFKTKEYYAEMPTKGAYIRARQLITCFAIACVENNIERMDNMRAKYLELCEHTDLCNEYNLTQDITKHLDLHMLHYDILARINAL